MGLTVFYTRIGHSEHDFITIYSGSHTATHLAWITAHAGAQKGRFYLCPYGNNPIS